MIFYNDDKKILIITNYKVMFSSLNNSKYYKLCSLKEFCWLVVKPKMRVFFLKRSPHKRLESFYKDKIVQNPSVRNENIGWQVCQQTILDSFSVKTFSDQKKFFSNFSYEEFVKHLSKYYLKDRHLTPQYMSAYKKGLYFGSFIEQIDIDDNKNKDFLKEVIFNGEESKRNTTFKNDFEYTEEMIAIIKQLYSKDFKYLNY